MEAKKTIRLFIEKYIDGKNISDDDNIFDGFVNSLFAMQLVSFIENEFDIVVENDDLDLSNFKDINSITAFINSKLSAVGA